MSVIKMIGYRFSLERHVELYLSNNQKDIEEMFFSDEELERRIASSSDSREIDRLMSFRRPEYVSRMMLQVMLDDGVDMDIAVDKAIEAGERQRKIFNETIGAMK